MPRKSSAEEPDHPPYIEMAFEAITQNKDRRKGASRAAIANYIKANFEGLSEGGYFNAALRNALNSGIESGFLTEGDTKQRYKLTDLGRSAIKKGRKAALKEDESPKPKKKKKKTSTGTKAKAKGKKKTTTSRKKKTTGSKTKTKAKAKTKTKTKAKAKKPTTKTSTAKKRTRKKAPTKKKGTATRKSPRSKGKKSS